MPRAVEVIMLHTTTVLTIALTLTAGSVVTQDVSTINYSDVNKEK